MLLLATTQSSAQSALKSPDDFLSHRLGEAFTPHYMLTDYFEYLSANSSTTMRLVQYGKTTEARPLQYACFSSPENLRNLEEIRKNNLRLAGVLDGKGSPDQTNPIAIVWISMSVHGNEPAGSECGLLLAYQLATQTDPNIKEWLKNTVVILDPAVNPDGYDRYTHWNRMASNKIVNAQPESREHREPWPGGRVNHYYFDLNRDWAWATQTETKQRILVYQNWLPHVHPDLHEQGIDAPYYFAPAAEPMHDYITAWQRQFQAQIGENHAHYFDQNGWLYFTKEIFDLFYPSYGDTYPMYNGSIGMTYEQGGGPAGGRAVLNDVGDTLTLMDRIQHHLTTSLSTIETASKNAKVLVENFKEYYAKTSTNPQGAYKAFVIKESNDPNKINDLCALLDLHKITYGRVGAGMSGVKAFDYAAGKEISASIAPNDLVISAYQPHSVLIQVLFEPESRLQDSLTYDITAWALPFAHGLEAYALKQRLEPKKAFEKYKVPEMMISAAPYTWCFRRNSLSDIKFLGALLQQGVKVRTATKAFAVSDQVFDAGDYIVNRADNRVISGNLDGIVKSEALKANVSLLAVFTGMANKGNDFGSEMYHLINAPEVAIVYGEEVDANAYGHIWFSFEQELGYPITPIALSRLPRMKLSDFGVIIMPDGYYDLSEKQMTAITNWIKNGGRLITCEGGTRAFADKEGFSLKTKEAPKKDSTAMQKSFSERERDGISDNNPGAIFRAKADNSHPLAFGLPDYYYTLKNNADVYEMPDKGTTAVWLEDNYTSFGFVGSRLKKRFKKTPIVITQSMGQGEVVHFVDSPMFRSFWQQGKFLFCNAVFY